MGKKKMGLIGCKNWTLQTKATKTRVCVVGTKVLRVDLNDAMFENDVKHVKFSFDKESTESEWGYKYKIIFKNDSDIMKKWGARQKRTLEKYLEAKESWTIGIDDLKQMDRFCVVTYRHGIKQYGCGHRFDITFGKAPKDFAQTKYEHHRDQFYANRSNSDSNSDSNSKSKDDRRRLAETKPLGWKPSQDMDWSPSYRQRRR